VAVGTPEELAASPGSYTGEFLRSLLERPEQKSKPRRVAAGKPRKRAATRRSA